MTNLYNEDEKKAIGRRIKEVRKSLHLTLKEFGEKFDPIASDSIVSRWERGINIPTEDRLKKIAELGNVQPKFLLTGRPYDNMTPEELEKQIEYEKETLKKENALASFKQKKYVQLEDFIGKRESTAPRYIYINGHKLDDEAINMLIKLFEGKEKNYPTDEEIETEYEALRKNYLEFIKEVKDADRLLPIGEHHFYKYH